MLLEPPNRLPDRQSRTPGLEEELPVPIESHLQPGERVLASCDRFYATSRRLIRCEKLGRREQVDALPYAQIRSVARRRKIRKQTVVLAFLVALLAVSIGPDGTVKNLLVVAGLIGLVFAFLNPGIYVEFRAAGLSGKRQARWRLTDTRHPGVSDLVQTVRAYADGSPLPWLTTLSRLPGQGPRPRRSVLLLPADRPDQLPAALDLRPDSLCLDVSDAVDPSRRDRACQFLWGEVTAASKSYSEVLVRLTSVDAREELEACLWPGLSGLIVPVNGLDQLRRLEDGVRSLEEMRRLPVPVKLLPYLHTPQGVAAAAEIASARSRVDAVVLDLLDLALPSPAAESSSPTLRELQRRAALSVAAEGVQVLGLLGASIPPGRLDETLGRDGVARLLQAAREAQRAGFHGALTPHPPGVAACNQGFGQLEGEGVGKKQESGTGEDTAKAQEAPFGVGNAPDQG